MSAAFYCPTELTFTDLFLYTPCLVADIFKTSLKKVTKKHSRCGRWGREPWWDGEGERMNHILGRCLRKGKLDRRDDVSFGF